MNKRQTLSKRCQELEKENFKLKRVILAIRTASVAVRVSKQLSEAMGSIQNAMVASQPKPTIEDAKNAAEHQLNQIGYEVVTENIQRA